ncbi:peptidase inhibitor family I36 protein [Actinomadura rubrisoli]|uniref:Peptidase inhibitor family I36 protein n=1 Tax=Actinomadura rubrisoli TaxID=2530368 RepID=A0A4R4ZUR9_9ACTN|nr:peptidase inhibitor family I36 protein [Actinomadura rubrisoli]TDD61739.1 hypothetical protein E1298_45120 [Actinomadura rubrisoli]
MHILIKTTLTAAATALVTGGLAVPAMAGTEAKAASCASDRVCFWTKTNYQGDMFSVPSNGQCKNIPARWDNTASSLIVGSRAIISSMRTKKDCKGDPSPSYTHGARVPDLGNFNNKMSSVTA